MNFLKLYNFVRYLSSRDLYLLMPLFNMRNKQKLCTHKLGRKFCGKKEHYEILIPSLKNPHVSRLMSYSVIFWVQIVFFLTRQEVFFNSEADFHYLDKKNSAWKSEER